MTLESAAETAPQSSYGSDREAISALLAPLSAPPFAAQQVFRWLYQRGSFDPAAWTNLSLSVRNELAQRARFDPGRLGEVHEASDGTRKFKVHLAGGGAVETVFMVDKERLTLCLSSQVGCALGCDFCLTAKMGLVRHLSAGEIVGQVALVRRQMECEDRPVNLVFMGMGEPLHNYEGVVAALRLLSDPDGFAIGRKRITLSTAGLAPEIERLAGERVRPRLAVSLNATTDALRDRLMPINRRYPISRLLQAVRSYARADDGSCTLEYVLLHGVNDTDDDVRRLGRLVRGLPAKLNLIPFNPVPGRLSYDAPPRERVLQIRDRLLADRVPVSVRWSHGAEARAACGQLAILD